MGLLTVYAEGSLGSTAATVEDARKGIDRMFEVIVKSQECSGCGSCAAQCTSGALRLVGERVEIDPDICTGCGSCFGPCPSIRYVS